VVKWVRKLNLEIAAISLCSTARGFPCPA